MANSDRCANCTHERIQHDGFGCSVYGGKGRGWIGCDCPGFKEPHPMHRFIRS